MDPVLGRTISMKILGIWDEHDAGAALIEGDNILFAENEERFTRRELEVVFPERSINLHIWPRGHWRKGSRNLSETLSKGPDRAISVLPAGFFQM